ncbi:MAG: hypothetical protein AAF587_25835 [Bacteroidota bacterium]
MAKKFLDILGDAFEDEALEDVIPQRKKTVPKRRKKRFIDVLGENLPEEETALINRKATSSNSLLDTMEEALDNQVFDELFPIANRKKTRNRRASANKQAAPLTHLESRFSTMITTEVLQRARQIAESKGIRVKDVINAALKLYIEKVDVK